MFESTTGRSAFLKPNFRNEGILKTKFSQASPSHPAHPISTTSHWHPASTADVSETMAVAAWRTRGEPLVATPQRAVPSTLAVAAFCCQSRILWKASAPFEKSIGVFKLSCLKQVDAVVEGQLLVGFFLLG